MAFLIRSRYYSHLAIAAADSKPLTSTDQMLASLSTNITILGGIVAILGGIVAIATLAIGVAAVYGYSELRTATFRKTEDDMIKVITSLQKNGLLRGIEAATILQSLFPGRFLFPAVPPEEPESAATTSNNNNREAQSDDKIAEYPDEG